MFAKMKGFVKSFMCLAASLLLASCTYRDLKAVERTMETDPVIADSLLAAFSMPERGRSQALYALLKTQIDYKMYRDADSDSLIRVATDYYGRKYKGYHAAMAWYSLGCISAELGNDSTAADAYLSALSLFPDTLVRYYALAEQNLSYIFLEHNMDDEAIQLIKSCRLNACRLADSAAIAFCDYNIGNYLLYGHQYDSAQIKYDKLLAYNNWLSADTKDIPLIQLSKIEFIKNNFAKAIEYADMFLRENEFGQNSTAYSLKGNALFQLGNIDSAHFYFYHALIGKDPYTTCDAFRRLSEIHSIKGNSDSAAYYAEKASAWMDTIVSVSNSNTLYRIINSHSKYIVRARITGYAILLIPLIAVIIVTIRRYKKTHKKTNSISDFADDIEEFKKNEIYLFMVSVINGKVEYNTKIMNQFKNDFSNSLLNLRFFISNSAKVNSVEIDFCVFIILGFHQKDFALLFNVSHYRLIKYRLKGKLPENIYDNIFESSIN